MTVTKLELVRGSEALDISDEIKYIHEEHDGFGAAPLRRITDVGHLQHGVTDRGFWLQPRYIQLVIGLIASSWTEHWARRTELINFLSPAYDDQLQLRFTLPDGTTQRQLDVYLSSGPSFPSTDIIGKWTRAGLTLYAPDPAWYDPNRQTLTFTGGGGTGFTINMVVPMTFGQSTMADLQVLDLDGDWFDYPEIALVGPLEDCCVTNQTTGEILDLGTNDIAAANTYTIDLRYGYKTVLDQNDVNRIDKLTTDSDLATWHLVPGSNSIQVEAGGITSASRVIIRYYHRYTGI